MPNAEQTIERTNVTPINSTGALFSPAGSNTSAGCRPSVKYREDFIEEILLQRDAVGTVDANDVTTLICTYEAISPPITVSRGWLPNGQSSASSLALYQYLHAD